MITFRLSVDVLGNTRFAFSPMAEVAASLRLLAQPRPVHLHEPWLRRARPASDRADLDLLLALVRPSRWAAGFLYPLSTGPDTTLDAQLEVLGQLDPQVLRDDLGRVWEGRELPPRLVDLLASGAAAPALLAEAISTYWSVAIAPVWSRMCRTLEDDVSYRAGRSLRGGLFDLLADLHPEVGLDGAASALRIDKPRFDDATYDGAQLTLVPSIFVWPRLVLAHTEPASFELTYAARGVARVWEGMHDEAPHEGGDRLAALMGRTRAAILEMLHVPMSTTQVARRLGQSPGTVSAHLSILRDAGMLTSWRSGRSVLYRQTPLAASVVTVARSEGGPALRAVDS